MKLIITWSQTKWSNEGGFVPGLGSPLVWPESNVKLNRLVYGYL